MTASLFLDAVLGNKSRVAIVADQFVVVNPDDTSDLQHPLEFVGGTLYLDKARIREANIDDLTVGTLKLKNGAVSNWVSNTEYSSKALTTSWQQFNGITLSMDYAGTALISFSAVVGYPNGESGFEYRIRKVGGSTLFYGGGLFGNNVTPSGAVSTPVSAGTTNFSIDMRRLNSTASTVERSTAFCTGLMR